jgi:protein required for attachment to host cells
MSTTWILVANAGEARLFSNSGPNKGLRLVRQITHPASREKVSDLISDRAGHGVGAGGGSFLPASDPKQQEAEVFAHELVKELEQGRVNNAFDRVILAANPSFLGLLNNAMSPGLRGMVSDTLQKDYTKATEKELAEHLQKVLCV